MRITRNGFTTVDCLVALILVSVGVLSTTATVALAIRAAAEGSQAARAARLLLSESARLSADLARGAGACAALTPGRRPGQAGLRLFSSATAATGGRSVQLVVVYPTVRGQHTDSASTFLPCH